MKSVFENRYVRWLAWVLVLLKLWFVAAQPMAVIAGAGHDDRLFFELARKILHGEWLGAYSQFTLMKGAGYPLLIAGAFKLGVPLPLAEHGLYLLACYLLVRALRPLLRSDGWTIALFALLVWQPMSFTMPPAHGGSVLRQNLYTPLTLFIFAGLAGLYTRRASAWSVRLGWALLLGLSFGWFWLTREESIWIAPSVALLVGVAAVVVGFEHSGWRRLGWPLGVAALAGAAPVLTVSTLNWWHYGWFGTCEFHAPQFVSAYGALTRVRVGPPVFRVPVTKAMRQAIYGVSPAFAELKPLLEGDLGRGWAGTGWNGETNGAMWMWELRDAVRDSGHAPTAPAALAFYQRLADEVNAACDQGRIPAGPRHDSFLPPWNRMYTDTLRNEGWPFCRVFFHFDGFSARPPKSEGSAEMIELFRDLGQWPVSRSDDAPGLVLPDSQAMRAWRIGALQSIGTVLCRVCTWLIPLGLVAWLATAGICRWQYRMPGYLWWFAAACLGGALAVLVIALLVDITSWADTRPLRFAEAYPLILTFAATAIVEFVSACRRPAAARAAATGVPAESAATAEAAAHTSRAGRQRPSSA